MKSVSRYLWNVLIWIDQGLNVLFAGDPDETLSSRMGKAVREDRCTFCKAFCWFLDLFDKNHCEKSIEEDEGKRG
jgi:hypothetical protein